MIDLGSFGGALSIARGINNSGQVVGFATNIDASSRAFLYSNGSMVDLNSLIDPSLNITLQDAHAINDSGQIVVDGLLGGHVQAFLLTPVPEPSSILLEACGLLAIGLFRHPRQRASSRPK